MTNRFRGFSAEGIRFLRDLKKHNDREWFTPRKQIYEEQVRLPMIELVRSIHGEMLEFAPQYVGEPRLSACFAFIAIHVSRKTRHLIRRTWRRAFWRNGFDKRGAGYYLGISPEMIHVGGGLYGPEPDVLLTVRQLIATNLAEFRKTFSSPKVKKLLGELSGESAARAPKGFDAEDPAIEYLKRRQHVFMVELDPAISMTPKLLQEVVKRFEAMTPAIEFLNRAMVGTARKAPG